MKYRFILLDADNTLLDFDACEKEAFWRAMEDLNVCATNEMYDRYSSINQDCWKKLELGLITREELQAKRYAILAHEFSLSIDPKETNERYISYLSTISILIPGAMEFVKSLSQKAELYIITNGLARVQTGRFKDNPLLPYLSGIFISEKVGAGKPDKLFFDRVTKAIPDFDPALAIVIGDSLTSDIKGANNAGLPCIWYNPKGLPAGDAKIDFTVSEYDEILHILEQGDIHEN